MMRRMIAAFAATVLLAVGITACGSSADAATAQDGTAAETAQTQEAVSDNNGSEKKLRQSQKKHRLPLKKHRGLRKLQDQKSRKQIMPLRARACW